MRTLTATLFTGLLLAFPMSGVAADGDSPFQYDNEKSPFTGGDQTASKGKPTKAAKPKFNSDDGPTFRFDEPVKKPMPPKNTLTQPPQPKKTYDEPVKKNVEPPVHTRETRLNRPYSGPPKSLVARLLQERAMQQARNRRARIQTRKWMGKSGLRPRYSGERTVPVYSLSNPGYWANSESYRMYWHNR